MNNSLLQARLRYQWQVEDWARGKLEELLHLNPNESYIAPRDQPFDAYDFCIQNYGYVECKNDRMCHRTGNVSIEYQKYSMNLGRGYLNDLRSSGLLTTMSAHYVIVIDRPVYNRIEYEILFIPTDTLRDLTFGRNRQTGLCNVNKYGVNTTRCYFIPYEELKQFSLGIYPQNIC